MRTVQDYIYLGEDPPVKMETYDDVIASALSNPVSLRARDEEGAALYFTSGTTGRPKPILLSHKNMECAAITNNYHRSVIHRDNFLNLSLLYHAGSIFEKLKSRSIRLIRLDAYRWATELGDPRFANTILTGVLSALPEMSVIPKKYWLSAIRKRFARKLVIENVRAFEEG